MFRVLLLGVEMTLLAASWAVVGWRLLPRAIRQAGDRLLCWTSALTLGAGATAVVLTVLAALHALGRPEVVAVIVAEGGAATFIALRWRSELRPAGPPAPAALPFSSFERVGALCLAVILLATFVATCAPASSMDATVYHLRVPSEFLRTRRWSKLEQVQSFQPLYVEMLFAEALVLGGGRLAALVHWTLGLAAIGSAAVWARRLGGRAIWGAVVFGASALYIWESTSAFIDLGLGLFASFALFWATADEADAACIGLGGIFGGLAAGAKFTGLAVALLAGIAGFCSVWPDRRRALRRLIGVGCVSVLIAFPWYLRDYLFTGNPIYPLANTLFGGPRLMFAAITYGLGTDLRHLLTSPFDLLVRRAEVYDSGWSIGPAYLALVPVGLVIARSRDALLVVFSIVAWWLLWFYSSPQVRLLIPILPAAAGLAGAAVTAAWAAPRLGPRLGVVCVLGVAVLGATASAGMYLRANGRAAVGLESADDYLLRTSWNYPAYLRANTSLPRDAKVASIGDGDNLFYLDRNAVWLGKTARSTADLQALGFSHELQISTCPLPPLDDGRRVVLSEGAYVLPSSRLSGGVFAQECYRISTVRPDSPAASD
jgi:hypothetical protein